MRYHGKAFRKKVKVLWHGIVNSGSGAHPTVRAQDRKGRMTDPDCLRTRIRSSDDLAVLPPIFHADTDSRKQDTRRTIQGNVAPRDSWIATSAFGLLAMTTGASG